MASTDPSKPAAQAKTTVTSAQAFSPAKQQAIDALVAKFGEKARFGLELLSRRMSEADSRVAKPGLIKQCIKELDANISSRVASIMHDPEFQRVEGTWRGIERLAKQNGTGSNVAIRLLPVSKQRLLQDFETAVKPEDSLLFRSVYTSEFDMLGGHPYTMMLGDYQFSGQSAEDVQLLNHIADVAKAALCPFITAPAPEMFGIKSFQEMGDGVTRDLPYLLKKPEYISWNSFRQKDSSRYVVMSMPRVLARLPFGPDSQPYKEGFEFDEVGKDEKGRANILQHDQYCWMNSTYAMGSVFLKSMSETGWFLKTRGPNNGGVIEDLPIHVQTTLAGDSKEKTPTERAIPNTLEKQLSDFGFSTLVHELRSDKAVYMTGATVHQPAVFEGKNAEKANKEAQIAARIQNVMAACRVSQLLKKMAYGQVGGAYGPADIEKFLTEWMRPTFTSADANPSAETKYLKPFKSLDVKVVESLKSAGHYEVVVECVPWDTFEGMNAKVIMRTSIDKKGN